MAAHSHDNITIIWLVIFCLKQHVSLCEPRDFEICMNKHFKKLVKAVLKPIDWTEPMFIKLQDIAFLQQNPFYEILKTQALRRQRINQYNATDAMATEKKMG